MLGLTSPTAPRQCGPRVTKGSDSRLLVSLRDTAGVQTPVNPSSIANPAANYHHAVLVENPTRWLHTSGVVPTAPDGSTPEALEDQAKVVWANIAAMLADADMSASDVVL